MKQVIVIRRDLGMRRGKEIVQGAHASQLALQVATGMLDPEQLSYWNGHWGMRKVCVQVSSEAELEAIFDEAFKAGLPAVIVVDEGLTEFSGAKTKTAVGIGPAEDDAIDVVTRKLKLY